MDVQSLLAEIRDELRRLGREVPEPEVYGLPAAAHKLSMSPGKLKRLIRLNLVLTVRIGDRSYVSKHEIERLGREGTIELPEKKTRLKVLSPKAEAAKARAELKEARRSR